VSGYQRGKDHLFLGNLDQADEGGGQPGEDTRAKADGDDNAKVDVSREANVGVTSVLVNRSHGRPLLHSNVTEHRSRDVSGRVVT
jgi:hypothetical protein